jgi:hypothetical protein
MSSMPTPVTTAGRDTSARTDTASQSIIVTPQCRNQGVVVNSNYPSGQQASTCTQDLLARTGAHRYDRSSMIRSASPTFLAGPAKAPVAVAPIAIIASKRR